MRAEYPFDLALAPGAPRFVPISFRGTEHVNRAYRFIAQISIAASEVASFQAAVVEQPASILLPGNEDDRSFHGLVDQCEVLATTADDQVHLALRIVPRFDLLRHKKQSRIFQAKTTRQIAQTILDELNVSARFELAKELPARNYACQYRQTDLAFIQRLFAEDGLFYWFDHPEGGPEVMVVADSAVAYQPIHGSPTLVYAPTTSDNAMSLRDDHVTEIVARTRIRPKLVLRRGFDMTHPALRPKQVARVVGSASGPEESEKSLVRGTLAHDDHLGPREETRVLDSGADRHLDALRRDALVMRGSSTCRRLQPGHTFQLDGHAADLGSHDWVVVGVSHRVRAKAEAAQRGLYQSRFVCAPRTTALRPDPRGDRPSATSDTAIVVGPRSQELHTDELGRVKVQFHWDLDGEYDDRSSCWLRVQQSWAGAGFGAQFLPRVGMEVVVTFLAGDPDRPVITGALHNGTAPPPFAFPQHAQRSGIRTRSTPGGGDGHELIFGDETGSEFVSLRSMRALAIAAASQAHFSSADSLRITTGGQRMDQTEGDSHAVTGGHDRTEVGGGQTLRVAGASRQDIGASRATRVAGDDKLEVLGNETEVIAKSRTVVIGTSHRELAHDSLMVSGQVSISSGKDTAIRSAKVIRLHCGESSIAIYPDRIVLDADKIQIQAKKKISLVQGDESPAASLSLAGDVSIGGGEVLIASGQGAKLKLTANAELDGAHVRLGTGGAKVGAAIERSGEKATATFHVLRDWFPPDVSEVTLRIAAPTGEIMERSCAPGGSVEIEGQAGDEYTLVDLRVGETSVSVKPKNPKEE